MKPPFTVTGYMTHVISDKHASLIIWSNGYTSLQRQDGTSVNTIMNAAIPPTWQLVGPTP